MPSNNKLFKWVIILVIFSQILLPKNELFAKNPHQIYQPPQRKTSRQARKSGGSRGSCPQKIPSGITLLVPEEHIPLTVSPYPTLAWYQEQELSLPIKITLLEPGQQQPLFTQELMLKHSGIVSLTLPATTSALEIGKRYRWSVAIICNRQHPSQNPYAEAWVERIASEPTASGPTEKEQFCNTYAYAQAGIWYDALACELTESGNEPANRNVFGRLLEQVNLGYILNQQHSLSRVEL